MHHLNHETRVDLTSFVKAADIAYVSPGTIFSSWIAINKTAVFDG